MAGCSLVSFVVVPTLSDPFDASLYGKKKLAVSVGGRPLDGSPFEVELSPAAEFQPPSQIDVVNGQTNTALDAAGRCVVDYRPAFLEPQRAESLQQELLDATAWVGVKPQLPQGSRQPRQVSRLPTVPTASESFGG